MYVVTIFGGTGKAIFQGWLSEENVELLFRFLDDDLTALAMLVK